MLAARASNSHREPGIVTGHTTGYNQGGTVIIAFQRTVMVHRRGHGPITRPVVEEQG